jgi:electron transport complex protein RnfE
MTGPHYDAATRTGLGALALLPLLVASDSATRGLTLGLALLATLLACAIAAAVIGDRLTALLRGIALATLAAAAAAALQLLLRAIAPPPVEGHDALLALLAANGVFGWLAVSGGEPGLAAVALRRAIALGFGAALALFALGALRGLVGGLLASPIGGLMLIALALAAWQAWRQRSVDASVADR